MKLLSAVIEEFESGTWVADIVSLDAFDGSFEIAGVTWTGTAVSTRLEFEQHHSRVVGGGNGLAAVLADKFYDGNVSLQAAVSDVCRQSGETFGSATPGAFLTSFERLRGPAYAALDSIAEAFESLWWIGRDGSLNMKTQRDTGPLATGSRVSSVSDSVLLVEPKDVQLGGTYGDDSKVIRHVRWDFSAEHFEARLYFIPFIFRAPTQTDYDSHYDALVDRDNGDGTIDVIASGRFGVTKVKLFCGVPGSKVKVNPGEMVTLGFFGGDPQKPYCVAMAQSSTATKEVARNGDSVKVTINSANISSLAPFIISTPGGGPCSGIPGSVDVTGTITSGSERLKVGD